MWWKTPLQKARSKVGAMRPSIIANVAPSRVCVARAVSSDAADTSTPCTSFAPSPSKRNGTPEPVPQPKSITVRTTCFRAASRFASHATRPAA